MAGKRAERLQVMLTEDEVDAVEEWRFANRMPSRSAAVRALINVGLKASKVRAEGRNEAMQKAASMLPSPSVGVIGEAGVDLEQPPRDPSERPGILVVEDEFLIAHELKGLLEEAGYKVIGPTGELDEALSLAEREQPVAAVLDVLLGESKATALADELERGKIPFLFCTGYETKELLPARLWSVPVINKTQARQNLATAVSALIR